MSGYYTPLPEELHIGQEFEFRNRHNGKEWVALKDRTHEDLTITLNNYFNNEYRIKKLSEEDIVSLGWSKVFIYLEAKSQTSNMLSQRRNKLTPRSKM